LTNYKKGVSILLSLGSGGERSFFILFFITCGRSHFAHIVMYLISRQGYCRDIPDIFVLRPITFFSDVGGEKEMCMGSFIFISMFFISFYIVPAVLGVWLKAKIKRRK